MGPTARRTPPSTRPSGYTRVGVWLGGSSTVYMMEYWSSRSGESQRGQGRRSGEREREIERESISEKGESEIVHV